MKSWGSTYSIVITVELPERVGIHWVQCIGESRGLSAENDDVLGILLFPHFGSKKDKMLGMIPLNPQLDHGLFWR